jgi:hypothetical protein
MAGTIYEALDQIGTSLERAEALGPEVETSLDLLQAIYRSPYEPIARRMRAAIAALPFEHPKLAVIAQVRGGGIGDQLEAAIKRAQAHRSGMVIEGEITES